ncbi:nicotinamide-nucleotide amidase [Desulfonatronum thiosulfatophilum]|uniref:Nicotinamide-nucleotide amidase n=1 Tax=Desulfonatronum thiosulfatophilum TaxID=617002 RepID=A0A1G6C1L1_9BACT|nr:CinA family protein [Desulfonatronum thiosulfatophilum]SDB26735.1 nicotinamide-nucleotide amidase [Desulfonatronum thiosulfatophilum]
MARICDEGHEKLIMELGRTLMERGGMLAAAESCTGGLIAHLTTNISGSSQWFAGAVVAYANQVKSTVLNVPEAVIAARGAVSREVVLAMASGVRQLLNTQAALAVSGIAGPDGGTPDKPVGTVWVAWSYKEYQHSACLHFSGSRLEIKRQSALASLKGMLEMLREKH